jgi:FkbM family methyltransferase
MLISFKELTLLWHIKPNGVLHVGAHEAEEASDYTKHNWLPVTWVEAQPRLIEILSKKLDPSSNVVLNAAVWDESGLVRQLNVTTNSQSTSLLELGTHSQDYPQITVSEVIQVTTTRLDDLIEIGHFPNFINLDIQGVELQALRSLGVSITEIDVVYTEVNKQEVYVGCANYADLKNFLSTAGFEEAAIRWVPGKGWGDALFLRKGKFGDIRLRSAVSRILSIKFYGREYISLIKSKLQK